MRRTRQRPRRSAPVRPFPVDQFGHRRRAWQAGWQGSVYSPAMLFVLFIEKCSQIRFVRQFFSVN
jgi:hypothetical protein